MSRIQITTSNQGGGGSGDVTQGEFDALESRVDILESAWLNIKAAPYSAAGDGTTDDTATIQSAIDDLSASGGGTIYFPPGTYKTTDELVLGEKKVSFLGSGSQSSIIKYYGSGKCIELDHANNGPPLGDVFERGTFIDSMAIVCNTWKGAGTIGIEATNTIEVLLQNLIITGFETGLQLNATVQELMINHVKIDYCALGLDAVEVNQVVANNLMFNFNDQAADLSGIQVFRMFGGLVQGNSSTGPGIVHTGSVSSGITVKGVWFENTYNPMIQLAPSIGITGIDISECRFTYTVEGTGLETFIDLSKIQGGSLTNNRFLYGVGQKLLKVRNSQNIFTFGNDFNTNATSSNLDIDDLNQVLFAGGPGVGRGMGLGRLPLTGTNLTVNVADFTTLNTASATISGTSAALVFTGTSGGAEIKTNVAASGGYNDRGFIFKTTNVLQTENNTGDSSLVRFDNGSNGEVFRFMPGGRMLAVGPANNSQPGVYVYNPNGSGVAFRTAGGSGEIVDFLALTNATTVMNVGMKNSSGTMYLGPTAANSTAELTLTGTVATLKSGMELRVGQTTNANSSTIVSSGVIEAAGGGFRFPDGSLQITSTSVYDINVKGAPYNAVGNGIADDTAAIQAAINAASGTSGKIVYFPTGTYKVSSTLTISATTGITLIGASTGSVLIQSTSALSDLPILKLTDVRDSYFKQMTFRGLNIATRPKCAIQVNRGSGTGSTNSHNNRFSDLYIGDPYIGFQEGIRLTCDPGKDTNNDIHTFENIIFSNIENYCMYIQHSNSLAHTISNVGFGSLTGTGIYAEAGSFKMRDCWFYCPGGYDFQLGMDATQAQGYHPFIITNCGSESNGRILKTNGYDVEVRFNGYARTGGYVGDANQIEINGDSTALSITGCRMFFGQPTNKLAINGSGCEVTITDSRISFTHLLGGANGYLRFVNNFHDPGIVDSSGLDSTCIFTHQGEVGGGFTTNTVTSKNFTNNTTATSTFTSNVADTSTYTDTAFVIRSANTLLTGAGNNNSASIITVRNNNTDVFKLTANGMLRCQGTANNVAPGIYITTPTGGKALLRVSGGSGDSIDLIGDGGINQLNIGYLTTTVNIGPSSTPEVVINSTYLSTRSTIDVRIGQTTNTNSSKLVVAGTIEATGGNFLLGATGTRFQAFNNDSKTLKFTTFYSSDSNQFGQGQLQHELWFGAINTNGNRRIGFYLSAPDDGLVSLATSADMYVKLTGVEVKNALSVGTSLTVGTTLGVGSTISCTSTSAGMLLTSNLAATAGTDTAFWMKAVANLDTTASHTDAILELQRNNGSTSFRFNSSGRILCAAGQNNGQPGLLFTTPTGGLALFRLAGGSGEIMQLSPASTNVTRLQLGGETGNANFQVEIGKLATELIVKPTQVEVGTSIALIRGGTASVTAFAGGGQASATALTSDVNFVTTVATAGDSVKLPTAALGKKIVVVNNGAEALNVYPASGAAIDALGTNAPYSINPGTTQTFLGRSSTAWYSSYTAGGSITLGTAGSTPNASGASLAGTALTLQPADATYPGIVSTTTQTFAGAKTFSSSITTTALTFSDTASAIITSNVTPTGSNDTAFIMRAVGNFDTTAAHTDSILTLQNNNGTNVIQLKSSGRIQCIASQNNGQPGMLFTTPTGGQALFRLAGGAGEIYDISAANGGVTSMTLGYACGTINFGPSATPEVVLTSSALTMKTGIPIIRSGNAAVTAFAGGGQSSATALTSDVNFVATVATTGDSVKLPTGVLGKKIIIFNDGANSVDIFPASGAAIDALATNAAYSLGAGASREFYAKSSTVWKSR